MLRTMVRDGRDGWEQCWISYQHRNVSTYRNIELPHNCTVKSARTDNRTGISDGNDNGTGNGTENGTGNINGNGSGTGNGTGYGYR